MFEVVVEKKTKSSKYFLKILVNHIDVHQVLVNKELCENACKNGCNLYGKNGGCPPYAPTFEKYCSGYKYLHVIALLLPTSQYPEKVLNGNHHVRWSFVEALMRPMLRRVLESFSQTFDGKLIGSGHCTVCKPCAFKIGEKRCRNPKKRTFSLEALGVLVAPLVKQVFGVDLDWWYRGDISHIPRYMVKVGGVATNDIIDDKFVTRWVNNFSLQNKDISLVRKKKA